MDGTLQIIVIDMVTNKEIFRGYGNAETVGYIARGFSQYYDIVIEPYISANTSEN